MQGRKGEREMGVIWGETEVERKRKREWMRERETLGSECGLLCDCGLDSLVIERERQLG